MLPNTSISVTTNCPTSGILSSDAPHYHWLAVGYTILFILALTANLRVLFKLFHYSRRRFRDHILLLNLCAADLFVTLVYIPSEIYAYTVGHWHSDGICKMIAALKGLGIYVSSFTIIGISLDRYLSIVHPLTVYQSNIRNKLFVVGSWLISALACIPQLIIFKRLRNESLCREICGDTLSSDRPKRLAYNVAVAVFAYLAPLITIFYSYFRILYVLQKRCGRRTFRFVKCHSSSTRSFENSQSNYPLKSSSTKSFNQDRGYGPSGEASLQEEINTHNMKTITRAKLKTLKLTAIIVICFILCWTPYYCIVFFLLITDSPFDSDSSPNSNSNTTISSALDPYMYNQPMHDDEGPLLIVMMLAVSNSVLDPLIYGCYLVPPTKSNCFRRIRNRKQAETLRRAPGLLAVEKESKLTTTKTNLKIVNHIHRIDPLECQLPN